MSVAAGIAHRRLGLCRIIVAASLVASLVVMGGCTLPGSRRTIEPPVPLSDVSDDMLNPDGTFRKNGLAPVDPSEQR